MKCLVDLLCEQENDDVVSGSSIISNILDRGDNLTYELAKYSDETNEPLVTRFEQTPQTISILTQGHILICNPVY